MVYILVLLAIAIGLAIGRKYSPKNKLHKYLFAFLLPIISGFIIVLVIAAFQDPSSYGFWYRLGGAMAPVVFAVIAFIITLLITLKVKTNKSVDFIGKKKVQKLHYGTGEDRVDFEMELSEQEIAGMKKMRKQDRDKWKDNDLELVKAVKALLESGSSDTVEKKVQKLRMGTGENVVEFEMELTQDEIDKMEEIRSSNPDTWLNNDLELVKAAKKALQEANLAICDTGQEKTDDKEEGFADGENEQIKIAKEQVVDEPKEDGGVTEAKLESEHRKELATGQHWIRQNGTEMCINIDDDTYQQMIKMQNENPKKWVDNEYNLFLAAKATQGKNRKKNDKRIIKWIWIITGIVVAFALYGITASIIDNSVATCNETLMHEYYEEAKYLECVDCNYSVFRYRMIANTLYRKKMHHYFYWTQLSYEEFSKQLEIKNRIENPFVWVW